MLEVVFNSYSSAIFLLTDIDECADIRGMCRNGLCANTEGSYECSCFDGFQLSRDREECVGKTSLKTLVGSIISLAIFEENIEVLS